MTVAYSSDHSSELSRRLLPIYDEVNNAAYKLCFAILDNQQDAEDIVSDSMVKLIDKLKEGVHITNIKSWLCVTAKNGSLDKLRRDKRWGKRLRHLSYKLDEEAMKGSSDFLEIENMIMTKMLGRAALEMAGLNEKQQEVFNLFRKGLTTYEIANELDVDFKTADKRLKAALSLVKAWFGAVVLIVISLCRMISHFF